MNLFSLLNSRSKPITIGIIGAGKFATMFFAQALKIPSIHIVGVVDIKPENAKSNMEMVGWDPSTFETSNLSDAFLCGKTFISDNWEDLVSHESIEIIVECTGNPIASVQHCLSAFKNQKNVINVTVEADAFCGFALSQKAKDAGVIYSMAYGDQPALTCELVDWARTCGFNVIAAGRGHKWLKHYQKSTPDTVWGYWGLTKEQAERGRLNPKMFNAGIGALGDVLTAALRDMPEQKGSQVSTRTLPGNAARRRNQLQNITPLGGSSVTFAENGKVLKRPMFMPQGGTINGPGGPRDDLVPVMASNGEYMLSKAAVDAAGGGSHAKGVANLNKFNEMGNRRYG